MGIQCTRTSKMMFYNWNKFNSFGNSLCEKLHDKNTTAGGICLDKCSIKYISLNGYTGRRYVSLFSFLDEDYSCKIRKPYS